MKTISSCPGYIRGRDPWPNVEKLEKQTGAFHASACTYRFPVAFSPRVISFHRFFLGKNWNSWAFGNVSRLMTLEWNRSSRESRGNPPTCEKYYGFRFGIGIRVFLQIAFLQFFERRVRLFSRWSWSYIFVNFWNGEFIVKNWNFIYFLFETIF